jgi:hypothetical protein
MPFLLELAIQRLDESPGGVKLSMPSPDNGAKIEKVGIRFEFFDDVDIGGIGESIRGRLMDTDGLRN